MTDHSKRRACDQCHGTDTQYECERGQCYAEEYQRQQELKPCPFCGGTPEIVDARLRFVVCCTQCGCANVPKKWHGEFDEEGHREATDGDVAAWKEEAITLWNTRAPSPPESEA